MDKFWGDHIEKYQADKENRYIITRDGECYVMGVVNQGIHGYSTGPMRGYGGAWFGWADDRYDGAIRVCNSMWYIGKAPYHVLKVMKPNADMIKHRNEMAVNIIRDITQADVIVC